MEYYEVAAKWWADKIRNISPANFDMGDDSDTGGLAMVFMTLIAQDIQIPEQDIAKFEHELAEFIKENVESNGSLSLDCDYDPVYELSELASKHNVDTRCFPWKTNMLISKEEVSVSYGYGKPYKVIYPET